MEKVNEKFLSNLERERIRKNSPLQDELSKLEVGEILFISKEEWNKLGYKTKPGALAHSATHQQREGHKSRVSGWQLKTTSYKDGWAIKRIK